MGLFASYPTPGRPQPLGGDLRLPRAPGLIRRFAAEHPRTVDTLVALVYLGVSITGSGSSASYDTPNSFAPGSAWQVNGFVPAIIMAIILFLFRRTQPWLILPIAFVADAALGPPLDFNISIVATLFALYPLAVYPSIPQAWLGLVCAVIGYFAKIWVWHLIKPATVTMFSETHNYIALVLCVLTTFVGVSVGSRRRYTTALISRAQALARERDQQARLAEAAERARIGRDMHDIVSHGLTVMITLAEGSAATATTDSRRAIEMMRLVAESGREALGEMRRMLEVFHLPDAPDENAALEPQPTTKAIPDLVARFRETGLRIKLLTRGVTVTDPALQLTIYRIVQEGLANVLRHARDTPGVLVRIFYQQSKIDVQVFNEASTLPPTIQGAGWGLAGLAERVALIHGTLHSAPTRSGGWLLQATLRHVSPRANTDVPVAPPTALVTPPAPLAPPTSLVTPPAPLAPPTAPPAVPISPMSTILPPASTAESPAQPGASETRPLFKAGTEAESPAQPGTSPDVRSISA